MAGAQGANTLRSILRLSGAMMATAEISRMSAIAKGVISDILDPPCGQLGVKSFQGARMYM
jgi:hypothetical protein